MYHAPDDLTEALEIARDFGGRIVAGGTDLYPSTAQGHRPSAMLDITRIKGLTSITSDAAGTRIGAAVTWSQIARADLPPAFDGLRQAAVEVGSVQIQNAGTIAGNLCNASPAADGVPPLLTLDAEVEMASLARGTRRMPLSDFLRGVRQTALAPDELVTAIHLPPLPQDATSAFAKLGSRRYLVISITMSAVLLTRDDRGRIAEARVAVGACSPVARRMAELEAALVGADPAAVTVDPGHLAGLAPIDDVRGSGAFRLDVVARQIERAVRQAVPHG